MLLHVPAKSSRSKRAAYSTASGLALALGLALAAAPAAFAQDVPSEQTPQAVPATGNAPAQAEPASPVPTDVAPSAPASDFSFSANVAVTSDYIFRGVSQTNEHPAPQAGVDVGYKFAYAGFWASHVDFTGDPTDFETDFYGGIKPTFAGFSFDIGAIYYGYTGQGPGHKDDYWEAKVAVSKAVGKASIGAVAFYSPNFFGETDDAWYYEVNGAYPVFKRLSVSGAVGHQDVSYHGDYTTWNAGATFALTEKIGLDVRYYDTDHHGFGDIYGNRVVGTIKAVF